MRIHVRVAIGACLVASAALVGSCAPRTPDLVTQGLLSGAPCAPPCWQGLVPGLSTIDQINEFLRDANTYRYIDVHSVERSGDGEDAIITWRRRGETQRENWFDVQNGVLEVMNLHLDSEVTLAQLVEKYGLPDKFEAGLSLHPGPVDVTVDLFYGTVGMMPEVRLESPNPVLEEDTRVVRTWYFEPSTLEGFYAAVAGNKGEPLEDYQLDWLDDWGDWPGYGPVELTY